MLFDDSLFLFFFSSRTILLPRFNVKDMVTKGNNSNNSKKKNNDTCVTAQESSAQMTRINEDNETKQEMDKDIKMEHAEVEEQKVKENKIEDKDDNDKIEDEKEPAECRFKRKGRVINSKTARAMLTWSHFTFRQRLLSKAREYPNTKVVICDEDYTSKTCGKCGNIHEKLGGNKIFKCPQKKCDLVIDRDCNGARNIALRFLTKKCSSILKPLLRNSFVSTY